MRIGAMMYSTKRRKDTLPSKQKIYEFWIDKLAKFGKGDLAFGECFGCGLEKTLQRAHIKPEQHGGSCELANLHLLCRNCHEESEIFWGDLYWDWFNSKDYDEEFDHSIKHRIRWIQNILNRLNLSPDENVKKFNSLLREEYDKMSKT